MQTAVGTAERQLIADVDKEVFIELGSWKYLTSRMFLIAPAPAPINQNTTHARYASAGLGEGQHPRWKRTWRQTH